MAQEEIEVDDVADKAKQIGKDLGAEEMNASDAENLPDYEIIEEDDKPLAKERIARDPRSEKKELTNQEKRALRKKRLAEKFNEKDAIIEQQQRQLDEFSSWKNHVEGRLSTVDKNKIDDVLNQNISAFQKAEKDHADAFTEGDGIKATAAMKVMYETQRNIDKLQGMKQQIDTQPTARQVQQQSPTADASIVRKAKEWASKHDWYNADGNDEDSAIAKAISGTLANEGYDPKSNDFWDELDDRLNARGIGVAAEEDIEEEDKPVIRKRANPPVGSGAKRGDLKGKKTITLPTSYIKMLKDNGIWDDPKRRNKVIAERERILREASQ